MSLKVRHSVDLRTVLDIRTDLPKYCAVEKRIKRVKEGSKLIGEAYET
jgi:hypothetical protein